MRPYRDLFSAYLGPLRVQVVVLGLLVLLATGLQLAGPQIVRSFIDSAMAGDPALTAGLLFLAVALLGQLVGVAETYAAENVGWRATNALRADLTRHCLDLDLPFHNAHAPGEMIERIDGDVATLENFFSRFVLRILGSALMLVGVLALLFREDWRVGLLFTVLSAVALVVLDRVRRLGSRYALERSQARAAAVGFTEERLAGLPDVQANGAQAHVMDGLRDHLARVVHLSRRTMVMGGVLGSATAAIFTLGMVLAFVLGAYLYRAGAITLGTVYLIFQYTNMLRGHLGQISRQARDFQTASASVARVQQLLSTRRLVVDGPGAELPAGPLSLELEGVSFAYPDGREEVLRDVSLRLAPGRVLGVLGRTGSGKSSLARLIVRLYDPDAGALRIGGVDVRQPRLDQLRARVGLVTQEVQLFRGSVRDNVTLFDPAIADDQIRGVLGELGLGALAADMDDELPGLSAGQAQLLAFARVFLRDPGLVVLDEASSRLDPETERLLERAVDKLLTNRTAIVIAHRLATVERADEVLVLERGRVVEHGDRVVLARDPGSRFAELLALGQTAPAAELEVAHGLA